MTSLLRAGFFVVFNYKTSKSVRYCVCFGNIEGEVIDSNFAVVIAEFACCESKANLAKVAVGSASDCPQR